MYSFTPSEEFSEIISHNTPVETSQVFEAGTPHNQLKAVFLYQGHVKIASRHTCRKCLKAYRIVTVFMRHGRSNIPASMKIAEICYEDFLGKHVKTCKGKG